jgi:hypothetical protein
VSVRRETWVYVGLFVAVVAGGVAWIAPRLSGGRPRRPETPAPAPLPETPPAAPTPPPPPPPEWRTVRVAGEGGQLLGPL